jgi:hypothetical protein
MQRAQLTFIAETDGPGWPERLEAAAGVLEALFPGDRLHLAISSEEGEPEQAVTNRRAYFTRRMATRRRWFALRGEQVYPAVPGATHPGDHAFLVLGGSLLAGSPACMAVAASFVADTPAQVERVLGDVGDALGACSSWWSPPKLQAWQRVLQTGARDVQGLAALTPAGVTLPRLHALAARDPLQPEAGGWWNYWSARTCAFLGLSDPGTDPDFRDLSRPTPQGGWLVKLGPDAPELTPGAMERLEWLHRRLPALGLRA